MDVIVKDCRCSFRCSPSPETNAGPPADRPGEVRLLNEAEFLQGKNLDFNSRLPAPNLLQLARWLRPFSVMVSQ